MHKITNLWTFELNWSLKLRDSNERKNPSHKKLCAFRCLISWPQNRILRFRNQTRGKSFSKTTSLQREPFLKMFYTGCVRLTSLGHPRSALVPSNSFWRHSRSLPRSAPCALLVEWVTLGLAPGKRVTTRAGSCRSFSSCQGLTRVSTSLHYSLPSKVYAYNHFE